MDQHEADEPLKLEQEEIERCWRLFSAGQPEHDKVLNGTGGFAQAFAGSRKHGAEIAAPEENFMW